MSSPARKLGKLPVKHDARTLFLSEVLIKPQLPAPEPFDYLKGLPDDLGMMGNDVAGNCTCAGIAHLVQVMTFVVTGTAFVATTDQVIDLYKAITKEVNGREYDPNDPDTDTGLALLDVLKYVRNNGFCGHAKGMAFAKLHHNDQAQVEIGGRLFGGTYTGAQLPIDAQSQLDADQPWTPTDGAGGEPGGWGGHCMTAARADETLGYITWGKRRAALWPWVAKYADEMYVGISPDWINGNAKAPSGFDLAALRQYLSAL